MHTKTCQNYLWPVLRRTICHIKVPSRSLARRHCRQPPALGLSISLLAINNVQHRHDKPLDWGGHTGELRERRHALTKNGRINGRTDGRKWGNSEQNGTKTERRFLLFFRECNEMKVHPVNSVTRTLLVREASGAVRSVSLLWLQLSIYFSATSPPMLIVILHLLYQFAPTVIVAVLG